MTEDQQTSHPTARRMTLRPRNIEHAIAAANGQASDGKASLPRAKIKLVWPNPKSVHDIGKNREPGARTPPSAKSLKILAKGRKTNPGINGGRVAATKLQQETLSCPEGLSTSPPNELANFDGALVPLDGLATAMRPFVHVLKGLMNEYETFHKVYIAELMVTNEVAAYLRAKPDRVGRIPFEELPYMNEGAGKENLYLRSHVVEYVKRQIERKLQNKNSHRANNCIDDLADSVRERSSNGSKVR